MTAPRAPKAAANAYAELFPAVYLQFHRRDGKRRELSGPSRAVLHHLAIAGPLTVGECARHFERAQSVVSDIVEHLVHDGWLARVRDEQDRRRTLVWLTDAGRARLVGEQEVLSKTALARAFTRMTAEERAQLLAGTRALIRAAKTTNLREKRS